MITWTYPLSSSVKWVLQTSFLISTLNAPQLCNVFDIMLWGLWSVGAFLTCIPLSKRRHHLHGRPISGSQWHHIEKKSRNVAKTVAEHLNRKLYFMWLAKHCSAFGCIQEASITHWSSVWKRFLSLWACTVTYQGIHHKMAQGSFASRIFHKYCKNSQEQRGQESEAPRISEFTIMWDKLSKCSVLPLHLKYVGHPLQLWAGWVSACICSSLFARKLKILQVF